MPINYLQKFQNKKNGKFKYLPQWILFLAKSFYKEYNRKNNPIYEKYKRGTIVYVKFGVNVGAELSGNHFAIVLDKSDNTSKGVLTVVPLSSKNKKYYQKLYPFDNVALLAIKYSLNAISTIKVDNREILENLDRKLEKLRSNSINYMYGCIMFENLDENTLKNKLSNFLDSKIEKINKEIPNFYKKYVDELHGYSNAVNKYRRYSGKQSYACVNMIQTISKDKVIPTNKYEAAGNIKVSNISLELIEAKIKDMYLNS